ncbi:hypothetical protein SprV_0501891100 [Sparganum proliferum]
MARVADNGAVSETFTVTDRVKQGFVLEPTLFSLMFSAILMDVHSDERLGIRVACRTDGRLLNQRRAHFQSRVSATSFHKLLFVVDCALNAISEGDMQRSMDILAVSCNYFDLVINTEKTMIMHQPPPDAAYVPPQINLNDAQLLAMDNFAYLSSTLSHTTTKIDDQVACGIFISSHAFGCLQSVVWNRHVLHIGTKLKMCNAVILLTLLYEAEIWTVYKKQSRRLNNFHLSCL